MSRELELVKSRLLSWECELKTNRCGFADIAPKTIKKIENQIIELQKEEMRVK